MSNTKMSEAEVSISLALFLIQNRMVKSDVYISIDGAHVKTGDTIHFEIRDFLIRKNCKQIVVDSEWRGTYSVKNEKYRVIIHSTPGLGDVSTFLSNGKRLVVESKKGSRVPSKSSQEYPLLREAIGQLMTISKLEGNEILAVAVPHSENFEKLISKWCNAPMIKKVGLKFLMVESMETVIGIEELI